MGKMSSANKIEDWHAAFACKDGGSDRNLAQSLELEREIYAPGSIPVEWSRCDVPGVMEWRNPWYSHEPRTPACIVPEMFCSGLTTRKPATRPHANGIHDLLSFDGTRSSPAWTVALCAMWGCRNVHEMKVSLDVMGKITPDLLPSELELAFFDFEVVIKHKRETAKLIFTPAVEVLVASVAASFKQEATACLPLHVLEFVLEFVDMSENGKLCAVSKDFREAAESDVLWREFYEQRFSKKSSESPDNAREGDADNGGNSGEGGDAGTDGDDDKATAYPLPEAKEGKGSPGMHGFKHRYRTRLEDPHVGDEVEVAWKGKFRLESLEVYDGTAWWMGRVVDKSECPGNYKIHYPGWERKWDEWVPRNRLRWGEESAAKAIENVPVAMGDSVEMWCKGQHVPGAWLEAVVHGVEEDRLYLGEILTSGHFWVDPKRVRLVKKVNEQLERKGENSDQEDLGDMSPSQKGNVLMQALDEAGFISSGDDARGDCCCVM